MVVLNESGFKADAQRPLTGGLIEALKDDLVVRLKGQPAARRAARRPSK